MGFFGRRREHLEQLHQDRWEEVDDHLSLHGMQALQEERRGKEM